MIAVMATAPTRIHRFVEPKAYVEEWMKKKGINDRNLSLRIGDDPAWAHKKRKTGWDLKFSQVPEVADALGLDSPLDLLRHPDALDDEPADIREKALELVRTMRKTG